MVDVVSNLNLDKEDDYFSRARSEIEDLPTNYSEKTLDIGCGDGATRVSIMETVIKKNQNNLN